MKTENLWSCRDLELRYPSRPGGKGRAAGRGRVAGLSRPLPLPAAFSAEAFDVGETFSGVPYEVGLAAVEKIRPLVGDTTMAKFALKWILMFDAVTVAKRFDVHCAPLARSSAPLLSQ